MSTSGELEERWWSTVTAWERSVGRDWTYRGLDLAELVRFHLWDKVSRALRREHFQARFAREMRALRASHQPEPLRRPGRRAPEPDPDRPLVFAPGAHPRFEAMWDRLAAHPNLAFVAGRRAGNPPGLIGGADRAALQRLGDELADAILSTLEDAGIGLTALDAGTLRREARALIPNVDGAVELIDRLEPAVVVTHADNHPPYQAYVLAARARGIPALTLQHGLDCELRCLDEAFATDFAAWSPSRVARYAQDSRHQPAMRVTGNPGWDEVRVAAGDPVAGKVLWVTRPHAPEKCYSVHRFADEGTDILRAVGRACAGVGAELVIKPHPLDDIDAYRDALAGDDVGPVAFADRPVHELFSDAAVVVTEDSTAGLEAMFTHKPVVLAHFAAIEPTMPMAERGAALPGFDRRQLVRSVRDAVRMGGVASPEMRAAQVDFIADHAGPLDGGAGPRVEAYILDLCAQDG